MSVEQLTLDQIEKLVKANIAGTGKQTVLSDIEDGLMAPGLKDAAEVAKKLTGAD